MENVKKKSDKLEPLIRLKFPNHNYPHQVQGTTEKVQKKIPSNINQTETFTKRHGLTYKPHLEIPQK